MRVHRAVPFGALHRQHGGLARELRAVLDRALLTSDFVLGEQVDRFEAEFAAYCGVEHCVGVASGTAALTLALLAAGIGPGDEVIVPAHTFVASALAVLHAGAHPVACEVEDRAGLIAPSAAADAITARTAAIMPVHLYGQACDMDALGAIAGRHGLALVEDAAQAHGATWAGRRAGSLGDAAAFSFYPSKNLGALGDGGAICTDDPALAARARRLRDLGRLGTGEHAVPGFNERLDALQAAFLRVKLPHLEAWNARRREHAATYRSGLDGCARAQLVEERPQARSVLHLFPIRVQDRTALAAALSAAGVQTGIHYPRPLHHQPALAGRLGGAGELAVAEAWAREELSLPLYPELEEGEVHRVVDSCLMALDQAPTTRS